MAQVNNNPSNNYVTVSSDSTTSDSSITGTQSSASIEKADRRAEIGAHASDGFAINAPIQRDTVLSTKPGSPKDVGKSEPKDIDTAQSKLAFLSKGSGSYTVRALRLKKENEADTLKPRSASVSKASDSEPSSPAHKPAKAAKFPSFASRMAAEVGGGFPGLVPPSTSSNSSPDTGPGVGLKGVGPSAQASDWVTTATTNKCGNGATEQAKASASMHAASGLSDTTTRKIAEMMQDTNTAGDATTLGLAVAALASKNPPATAADRADVTKAVDTMYASKKAMGGDPNSTATTTASDAYGKAVMDLDTITTRLTTGASGNSSSTTFNLGTAVAVNPWAGID